MSDWDVLEGALVQALRRVTDRVFLVIQDSVNRKAVVQFATTGDVLTTEASGLVPEVHGELLGLGWNPPLVGEINFGVEVGLPALTAELEVVAARCVVSLRDVFGVQSPRSLEYEAWRDPEGLVRDVFYSGEELEQLDKGVNPLLFPELGIPLQS